jgi:hypothetical protein
MYIFRFFHIEFLISLVLYLNYLVVRVTLSVSLSFSPCKKVGDRCQVEPGETRGVVKFVGQAETLAPGFWIGIQYDEPLGKHDGMYVRLKSFNCFLVSFYEIFFFCNSRLLQVEHYIG